jgi:MFS family permease
MRNFGKIYGVMAALMALASGLGPLLAGAIYDFSGGYTPFLILGTIGCLIGGLLMITLPAYPGWKDDDPLAVDDRSVNGTLRSA